MSMARLVVPTPATSVICCVDAFSLFKGVAFVDGWAFSKTAPIQKVCLVYPSGRSYSLGRIESPSPDVAAVHGALARQCRFEGRALLEEAFSERLKGVLHFHLADGSIQTFAPLTTIPVEHTIHGLSDTFNAAIASKHAGRYLEVGSRARSGITRRHLIPEGWQYTGLDVMKGENVDVVGDAHELSKVFPRQKFDAVTAFSVIEHILMPWKLAVEMNRVMNMGAVGWITTHQAWPIHDAPWDFWRFSKEAWPALFNQSTGFEIIQSMMGEAGHVIASRCHAVTHFSDSPNAFLGSGVVFRKVAETTLMWDVNVQDAISTSYPTSLTKL